MQNIYIAKSKASQLILRGKEMSLGEAKLQASAILGQVTYAKQISGQQALAYAICNIKVIDLDAKYIL